MKIKKQLTFSDQTLQNVTKKETLSTQNDQMFKNTTKEVLPTPPLSPTKAGPANSSTFVEDLRKLTEKVQEISQKIRPTRCWLLGEGICEVCGVRKAEVNLDLKAGTHRECRPCWDD